VLGLFAILPACSLGGLDQAPRADRLDDDRQAPSANDSCSHTLVAPVFSFVPTHRSWLPLLPVDRGLVHRQRQSLLEGAAAALVCQRFLGGNFTLIGSSVNLLASEVEAKQTRLRQLRSVHIHADRNCGLLAGSLTMCCSPTASCRIAAPNNNDLVGQLQRLSHRSTDPAGLGAGRASLASHPPAASLRVDVLELHRQAGASQPTAGPTAA